MPAVGNLNPGANIVAMGVARPAKLRARTLEELWRVSRPKDPVVQLPPAAAPEPGGVPVVDLYCGGGGFSCGARMAGHRVVLAVDCDATCLRFHRINHREARHVRMQLGPGCEERLLELIAECVPAGSAWHLHGSPPCQLFSAMRNLKKGRDPATGMKQVTWFVDFAMRSAAHSWSFEQVRAPQIAAFLSERGAAFGYFEFERYGVPQTRIRCIAGSGFLIDNFKNNRDLLGRCTPLTVLTPPRGATMIRASGGKCTPQFYRPLNTPTWALLAAKKPVYVGADHKCVRVMHVREIMRLQTFPACYRLPPKALGTEADCVRIVGNAVPPLVAKKLLSCLQPHCSSTEERRPLVSSDSEFTSRRGLMPSASVGLEIME